MKEQMCYQERNQHHACRPVHLLGLRLSRASIMSGVWELDPFSGFIPSNMDASAILGPPLWEYILKGDFLDSYTYVQILHRIKCITLFVGTLNFIYGNLSGLEGFCYRCINTLDMQPRYEINSG